MKMSNWNHGYCCCSLLPPVLYSIMFCGACTDASTTGKLFDAHHHRVVVTNQAMGARCAVVADFDGDGRQDIVSASSNDNAVSWFRNEGRSDVTDAVHFSIKQKITWESLGSRIVTVADINGDGHPDVVGASYYDSSLRWFENDGTGQFTPHLISASVNEGQGVAVADLDNDGDVDVVSASSGDNTIAVFKNLDRGRFCEIKDVVDDNAVGARTVVATDLNGDGWVDLASASKDDDTVAWYPNDGTGKFPTKIVISDGIESSGAYSLVAVDVDKDGDNDLIVASNGNDHVSLWRNDGTGNFTKTLIFDNADFVLSVTAVDFDRDGDIDVASASFFDGHINWYENVDGEGYIWKNHTIYVGIQGHYVSHGDVDGDGDDDLIAVTHAENTVAVFLAQTECDFDFTADHNPKEECCHSGTQWNGTFCETCRDGTYGVGSGLEARCEPCPADSCVIPGLVVLPATCSGYPELCADIETSVAACSCPMDTMRDTATDACVACPPGLFRPDKDERRSPDSIGNYSLWESQQGLCQIPITNDNTVAITMIILSFSVAVALFFVFFSLQRQRNKLDAMWTIKVSEISYDEPPVVLGQGSFGEVLKAYYRGTPVAIKKATPGDNETKNFIEKTPLGESTTTGSQWIYAEKGDSKYAAHLSIVGKKKFSSKKMQRLFIQEVRILSKLRHPCITTLMGAVIGKAPLVIMEYMENGSLRDLLNNTTFPLDPEQTLRLIRDIMQGIRFLHSANPPIIHGDLKCANVLVDINFRAKITDFGLSKHKMAVGTPFFMAPEVLNGGSITTQSDVYSFGVLLWEVMTHKVPYGDVIGKTSKEIVMLVSDGKLRPNCGEGLDEELVECMEACWAQEPCRRPSLVDLELKLIPLCGQNLLFSVMQEKNTFSKKQSQLLQDVFPEHISKALLSGEKVTPENHDCVTIYFSDIVGFTNISSVLDAAQVSDLLDRLYTVFDTLAGTHGVFKLETIGKLGHSAIVRPHTLGWKTGDSWVGVTNLTHLQEDHAARIARFAIDTIKAAQNTPVCLDRPEMGFVEIRIGLHSGPVVASVVGTMNPRYCLFGDSMNTASRIETTSEPMRVHCTQYTRSLAEQQDAELQFSHRGIVSLKGKEAMETSWLDISARTATSVKI